MKARLLSMKDDDDDDDKPKEGKTSPLSAEGFTLLNCVGQGTVPVADEDEDEVVMQMQDE